MTEHSIRMEILDLLARGKISIDDAVLILQTGQQKDNSARSDVEDNAAPVPIVSMESEAAAEEQDEYGNDAVAAKGVRWLRISVSDSDSGKNKVRINLPVGMIKFGLGMARLLVPNELESGLADIDSVFTESEGGMLIDVQDDENREHVQIYFE